MSRARVVATPWRPAATKEPHLVRRRICVTLRLGMAAPLPSSSTAPQRPEPITATASVRRCWELGNAASRRYGSATDREPRFERIAFDVGDGNVAFRRSVGASRRRCRGAYLHGIRRRSERDPIACAMGDAKRRRHRSFELRCAQRLLPRPRAHRARSVRTIAKSRRASAPTIGRPHFCETSRDPSRPTRRKQEMSKGRLRRRARRYPACHPRLHRPRSRDKSPELCAAVRRSVIDTARGQYGGWRPGHCDRPAGRVAAHRLHRHSGGRNRVTRRQSTAPADFGPGPRRRNADVCDVRDGPNTGRRRLEGLGRHGVYGDRSRIDVLKEARSLHSN